MNEKIKIKFMLLVLRALNIIMYHMFCVATDSDIAKQKNIIKEIQTFVGELDVCQQKNIKTK